MGGTQLIDCGGQGEFCLLLLGVLRQKVLALEPGEYLLQVKQGAAWGRVQGGLGKVVMACAPVTNGRAGDIGQGGDVLDGQLAGGGGHFRCSFGGADQWRW